MVMKIDPSAVQHYLNRLGYDITTDQLEEFVKDLKKLIKYDVRHCKCDTSESSSTATNYTNFISSSSSSCNYVACHQQGTTHEEVSDSSSSCCEDRKNNMEESCGKSLLNNPSKSKGAERNKETKMTRGTGRPRSSYIKTLQPHASQQSQKRSDPVTLYHKYQALWQQNKIPGVDGRAELRWNVREKMMGTDPQPRPVWRGTSIGRSAKQRCGYLG